MVTVTICLAGKASNYEHDVIIDTDTVLISETVPSSFLSFLVFLALLALLVRS